MPFAKTGALLAVALSGLLFQSAAQAQVTVQCMSPNYQYTECQAPLSQPQLVHQISSSSCILNKTWGFNPQTRRIWVAEGCSGVFADAGGYHHSRSDTYDENARSYDKHGHDMGKVVAGGLLAILLAGALDDSSHKKHKHTTSNDAVDTRPHFDKEGFPNFDTNGNYQGCHGLGCKVDNPDTSN